MIIKPRSEADAMKAAKATPLPPGWYHGRITCAAGKRSKRGNDMIELTVIVPAEDGSERTIRDWFTDSPLAALKIRHAAEAVGALAKYEAGEIAAADLAGDAVGAGQGHDVRVKLIVEKRRGYADANRIVDYAAAEAGRVVNLREAAG
jgi:hypothetical protein